MLRTVFDFAGCASRCGAFLILICAHADAGVIVCDRNQNFWLTGFNTAAGSPGVLVDFDSIPTGTNIGGTAISGMTFNAVGDYSTVSGCRGQWNWNPVHQQTPWTPREEPRGQNCNSIQGTATGRGSKDRCLNAALWQTCGNCGGLPPYVSYHNT